MVGERDDVAGVGGQNAETWVWRGVGALNEIVSWRGGEAPEIAGEAPPPRTTEGNWPGLLMNAVQWVDETKQE